MLPARAMRDVLPDRVDGFGALLWDKDERAAFVAKCFPHLAFEIFFILVREEFVTIDEQQKCRRRLARLRRVEKFQAMTGGAHWLASLDRVVQSAIEDRGRNLLLQLRRDVSDCFQQPLEVEP